jgi:4-hydroxy-2-oxoglutarate aldolase
MGARGAILASANPLGAQFAQIYETFKCGDHARAAQLQHETRAVEAQLAAFGIAGWKAALDVLGWYGGDPRLPILPLDAAAKAKVTGIMQSVMAQM